MHFQKACDAAKKNVKADSLDSLFYAASVKVNLAGAHNCQLTAPAGAEATLTKAISAEGATTQQIYYAVSALKNLGLKGQSGETVGSSMHVAS